MTGIEITLLVLGIIAICASFFVARKERQEEEEQKSPQARDLWSQKDEELIQTRVSEILEEKQFDIVDATERQMNLICNEKIMAIDEFSQQVLEKIDSNHQDVVFMYNLLNEKDKEIKTLVTEPVTTAPPKEEKKPVKEEKKPAKPAPKPKKKEEKNSDMDKLAKVPGNVNLQIQKMYREGKSVLEISKALDIGQGEVKLVIALYGGKGR